MTQETRFSRIAVTADDDDDFVIEAGVVASPAVEPTPAQPVEPEPAPVELEDETVPALAPESAPAPKPECAAEPAPAPAPKPEPAAAPAVAHASRPAPKASRPASSKSSDAYETTLEDLEGSSMSGVQKVIIAAAILAVAAFVAYLFLG